MMNSEDVTSLLIELYARALGGSILLRPPGDCGIPRAFWAVRDIFVLLRAATLA